MYRPTMSVRAMLGVVAFCALASVALVRASDVWASLMFTAALGVISLALLAAIFRRGAKQAFWIGFALFGWLYLWMAHWRGDPDVQMGPIAPASWRLQQDETGTLATTQFLVYVYNRWLPTVRKPPGPPPAMTTTVTAGGYGGYGGANGASYGASGYGQTGGYGATSGYGATRSRRVRTSYGRAVPSAPYASPAGPGVSQNAGPTPAIDYPAEHDFTRVGHSMFTIVVAFIGGIAATYLFMNRDGSRSPIQALNMPQPLLNERPQPLT